jgi:hypothetical protein
VLGWRSGFVVSEFVAGQPVRPAEVDDAFIATTARYLAWRARHLPAERVAPFDELLEMILINTGEGLGAEAAGRFEGLERWRALVSGRGTVAIDGRLFPHEWVRTERGVLKVDGVDHHDDHFFPGCQDIAWDLAGAEVEYGLEGLDARGAPGGAPGGREALLREYVALSGDHGVARVLPFYRVAYLAFRLGYTTLAAEAVGAGAERERFRQAVRRYTELLRRDGLVRAM